MKRKNLVKILFPLVFLALMSSCGEKKTEGAFLGQTKEGELTLGINGKNKVFLNETIELPITIIRGDSLVVTYQSKLFSPNVITTITPKPIIGRVVEKDKFDKSKPLLTN